MSGPKDILKRIKNQVECPRLNRCCFCFPLTKGVTAIAYISLIVKLLLLCITALQVHRYRKYFDRANLYGYSSNDDDGSYSHLRTRYIYAILLLTAFCLDSVFIVTFIVALHMKHVHLMKVYFYYALLALLAFLVYQTCYIVEVLTAGYYYSDISTAIILAAFMIVQIVVHTYLQILIWNTYLKAKLKAATVSFEKHGEVIINA